MNGRSAQGKRFVSMALAILMSLSLIPGFAFASGGDLLPASMGDCAPLQSDDLRAQSGKPAHIARIGGANDLSTMMEICEMGFEKDSCKSVVIVPQKASAKAIGAPGLAGVLHCPILLAGKYDVPMQTLFEIARVGASRAYVVAGRSAISNATIAKLRLMGLKVKRVTGSSAAAAANKVYAQGRKSGSWGKTAFVLSGARMQDGIAVSAYAASRKAPLFVASKKAKGGYVIHKKTLALMKKGKFERVYVLGTSKAVSSKTAAQVRAVLPKAKLVRLKGKNAVGISQRVAARSLSAGMSGATVGFTSRTQVNIGLMAGAACGNLDSPLVVVAPSKASSAVKGYVKKHSRSIKTCLLFGSAKVMPNYFRTALDKATR